MNFKHQTKQNIKMIITFLRKVHGVGISFWSRNSQGFIPEAVNTPLFLFTIWTTPIILKQKKEQNYKLFTKALHQKWSSIPLKNKESGPSPEKKLQLRQGPQLNSLHWYLQMSVTVFYIHPSKNRNTETKNKWLRQLLRFASYWLQPWN